MKAQLLSLLLFLLSLVLVGCSSVTTFSVSKGRLSVIDYDAKRRGVYVQDFNGGKPKIIVVSEPSPDVAEQYTAMIRGSAGALGKISDANISIQFSTQLIDLAKRSQTLQVLREALFRLNELYANGALRPEDVKELYGKVLISVEMISAAELSRATKDLNLDPNVMKESLEQMFISNIPTENVLNPKKPK